MYFVLLLATRTVGFINALIHGKDAWGTIPEGLYRSTLATALALATAWIGYSGLRTRKIE